ncbi:NADP-dependent oxidoreductase [Mucilaginibacter psychrotolerans]|uniref:NADP-dependent oxidoreductase n=1 Tax=Mucilaginibacter psychrotolerans TaxID=1524096 RepID=A0A4Y8SA30_9SPHI|nr:NADP-dependent oxidoreductase [Mucilaginibacter psychrotolerans]TFF35495.1 NADP-dependent oxidoreductase [Mucilaginibacter psychrotolerans]
MKAYVLNEPGDAAQLEIKELQVPQPGHDEVLIRVKAISINPVDVKTRGGQGFYGRLKALDPLILGWDIAGTVEKAGEGVTSFKPGDDVFGMVNFPGHGKAYAEYVTAPAGQLALKPGNISFEEAAAATLSALTAYQVLVKQAAVKAGQSVLIPAASGGVGHYAVQVAKYLGARVTGTSSAKNRDFVLSLGTDEYQDYNQTDLDRKVKNFDFVFDTVGGENIDRSLPLVKTGGTLISIPTVLSDDLLAKAKGLDVKAFFYLVSSDGESMKEIAALLEKGIVKSHVSAVFPFEEMAAAHRAVESGRTIGKVIVTV